MQIVKAFKFQLKTQQAIEALLSCFDGQSRFVWNKAWALNKARLANGSRVMRYNELAFWLTLWKQSEEYGFLNEAPSQVLQQKLKDLDRATMDGFSKTSRKRMPHFKKKGMSSGIRFPQGFKLDEANRRIFLPKIGWVGYRASRSITGTPKNVTVSLKAGKWYISIQTEQEVADPIHSSTASIGIDVGVARFAALSDGSILQGPNPYTKARKRLARLQRVGLRNKKLRSRNRRKAEAKVAKLHNRITNIRQDFLHKASTTICKNHGIVYLEDLKVNNMSRSAKGTKDKPGKNVKAKSGLNRSILDQGWGEFRRMLEYKMAWRGGQVISVPAAYTSLKCSACGHIAKENRKNQADFQCVACGHQENADVNAAKNIHAAGLAVSACGGEGSGLRHLPKAKPAPLKQEPPERAAQRCAA